MCKSYGTLERLLEKIKAFQAALILFEWDLETLAPEQSASFTAKVVGTLSEEYYKTMTGTEMEEAIAACENDEKNLSSVEKSIMKETKGNREKLVCIPSKEYREYAELITESSGIWSKAKKEENFESFVPTLEKVMDYKKKFASYRKKEGQNLYDIMLDENEKGFNMEILDDFFEKLKSEIVPLLKEIMEHGKEIDDSFLKGDYPEGKQRKLAEYLAEYVGFDFSKGVLAESAHPFTTNLHNHDVRITTHYSDRVDSSLFSVIHEAGHGIYEMGVADEITESPLGEGTSMGMHESQSRFYENILGRNLAFWEPVYGKLKELFEEELKGVSKEKFVEAINKVQPSLIRTDADELTYSLHILIRYEIEKMIVEENLDLNKLPEIWADKYEEYLGIRPQNPSEGVLQDIHWAQGLAGYFPSYALGNAFGAQLYYHMKKEMNVEELLESGKIGKITEYLRKHVHKFGKQKTSRQILMDTTGEDFTPDYFIQYLKEKYRKLYQL